MFLIFTFYIIIGLFFALSPGLQVSVEKVTSNRTWINEKTVVFSLELFFRLCMVFLWPLALFK